MGKMAMLAEPWHEWANGRYPILRIVRPKTAREEILKIQRVRSLQIEILRAKVLLINCFFKYQSV